MEHNRRVIMATLGALVARPAAGTAVGTGTAKPSSEPEQYSLPPLPYPANALEPQLSKEIITLHHDKHHKAYVDGLNKALAALASAESMEPPAVQAQLRAVAFNGAGHILHTLYFAGLGKDGGEPPGGLRDAVERDFGSVPGMLAQLKAAVATAPGSGWGILAWEPFGKRLIALQLAKHEDQMFIGAVPILALDAWEHAYYLQYQNRKPEYLDAVIKVIDWKEIGRRFDLARAMSSPGMTSK